MKGAGEPDFEHNFPPGSDMIGDILSGPMAGERMQFELFTRLAGFEEIGGWRGRGGRSACIVHCAWACVYKLRYPADQPLSIS